MVDRAAAGDSNAGKDSPLLADPTQVTSSLVFDGTTLPVVSNHKGVVTTLSLGSLGQTGSGTSVSAAARSC